MTAAIHPGALELAHRLADLDHVRTVCLIGSAARGEAGPGSDIDLLAVVDAKDNVKGVRRRAARELDGKHVQTRVVDEVRLAEILDHRSTFAVHVLREAVVVRDDGERFARLRASHSLEAPVRVDPDTIAARLVNYDDLGWCQGLYLYCLADCYAAGRAATFALLGRRGIFEFSATKAFALVVVQQPTLAEAAATIAALRPFFVLADRDVHGPLPFPYRDCRAQAEAAVAAAHALIDALPQNAAR